MSLEYIPNIHYIFFFGLVIFIIILILLIVGSYIILKLLQISIDNSNIFFYTLNKKSTIILNTYGNYNIKKVYIIKQPIRHFIILICDFITLFNYSAILNKSENYHTSLLFEIDYNGNKKFILLEKNNSINLTDNFLISGSSKLKQVKLNKKNMSLNTLLEKTKQNIGLKNFYSWNIAENNCLEFTKNILQTLDVYNSKYEKYIYKNNILMNYKPTELIIHTFNTLCSIVNILERYFYENILY
jgi:hypothetical protein